MHRIKCKHGSINDRDLEAGGTQYLKSYRRDLGSNLRPLSPQAKSLASTYEGHSVIFVPDGFLWIDV